MALTAQSPGHYALTGALDLHTVTTLWPLDTLALTPQKKRLELDLTQVDTLDSAGLAWLLEVQQYCQQQGAELSLKGGPTSLRALAKISGVEPLLSLQ